MRFGRVTSWVLLSVCCVVTVGYTQPMGCIHPDVIIVASRADTIFVDHLNATRNCCSTMTVDVAAEDFVVDFVEGETGEFCNCICCFNLDYEAHGFATGHYVVRVWFQGELVGEAEVDVEGPEGAVFVGTIAKGECLTLATVEEGLVQATTWGRLRTGFLLR